MFPFIFKIPVENCFYIPVKHLSQKAQNRIKWEKGQIEFKLPNHCKPGRNSGYEIVLAKPSDTDEILKVMRSEYFPQEPTGMGLGLSIPPPAVEQELIDFILDGLTVVAKSRNRGTVLGGCVNFQSLPWSSTQYDNSDNQMGFENLNNYYNFFSYVDKHPDLFKQYNVQQVFEMGHLFVKASARKRGIGFNLFAASRELGLGCGFNMIKTDATNYYTASLCEKMGMKMVKEIPYRSYVDYDSKLVIKPPDPHTSLKVYVDDRPQMSALLFKIQQMKKDVMQRKRWGLKCTYN